MLKGGVNAAREATNAAGLERLGELCEEPSHFICSQAKHTEPKNGNDTNVNKLYQ